MISSDLLKAAALFGAIRSKLCGDFDEYWNLTSGGLLRAMPEFAESLSELKEEAARLSRLHFNQLFVEIMSLPPDKEKLLRATLERAEREDNHRLPLPVLSRRRCRSGMVEGKEGPGADRPA